MDKFNSDYYKTIYVDIPTKVKLSLCKTRYDYFKKLFSYIASIRKYYTDDYSCGYNDTKMRYLDFAKNDKNDLDSLYPLLVSEFNATNTRRNARHIGSVGSFQYRLGKTDALTDVNYCIKDSKKAFMKKINEQLRKKQQSFRHN